MFVDLKAAYKYRQEKARNIEREDKRMIRRLKEIYEGDEEEYRGDYKDRKKNDKLI